jgi:hypothetical protein
MKRSVYLLGFIACFLLSSGLMFKVMHWPTANIQLVSGFLFLNFGLLPAYFFGKYNSAKA